MFRVLVGGLILGLAGPRTRIRRGGHGSSCSQEESEAGSPPVSQRSGLGQDTGCLRPLAWANPISIDAQVERHAGVQLLVRSPLRCW